MQPRNYQQDGVDSIFEYFSKFSGNPLLVYPTGCHAKGTEVLMWDGSTKKVEDVKVGDQLMGPDSIPRNVLALARGRQEMRKIIPVKGEAFVVNKDHKLALYRTNDGKSKQYNDLKIITVADYEKKSNTFKHLHKLKREGVVFLNSNHLTNEIDPYFLGLFLGDGNYTQSQVNITSADSYILDYCEEYFSHLGDFSRIADKENNKASTIHATTKVRNRTRRSQIAKLLDKVGLRGCDASSKFIPESYKLSSEKDRLLLLAGLIDSDGSKSCNGYDYITKSKKLANDIVFLCRSLGFAAYKKESYKKCQSFEQKRLYYRVSISGDCSKIPVSLDRLMCDERKQKKNHLVTGFKVEKLPEDDFYGFTLDQDHLYLTSDFIVHHNTGKSLIIAFFIRRVLQAYPGQRIIVLTHVKELISQNASKLETVYPELPIGIYSAGLKSRDTMMPVIFGGIASVNKKVHLFGHRDLMIVDEAHLISNASSTMYNKVIKDFKKINPYMKVIGLTATPFRLGQGELTNGGIFTDICCNYSEPEKFNWFIKEGYLAPLIPKRTSMQIDVSDVSINGGEFVQSQLQKAADKKELTEIAVSEMCQLGHDRKSWLIFSSGLEHSEHIAEALNQAGVPTTVIHSKLTTKERDERLKQHEMGYFRAIVNYGVLTTGYDNPKIDLIGMLRATQSPGLWVQMLGRGTRPCEGKANCLVLDFGGNAERLGPINDPILPQKRGSGGGGEPPIKICDECGTYNHPTARFCICCEFEFKFLPKIKQSASSTELIKDTTPRYKWFDVKNIRYVKHIKKSTRATSFKIVYYCGDMALDTYMEFLNPEHDNNFVKRKAREWWRQRHIEDPPETVDGFLLKAQELTTPKRVKIHTNKKHPEIVGYEF